jgi:hypothetical protein
MRHIEEVGYGVGGDGVQASTAFGIENLIELIRLQ